MAAFEGLRAGLGRRRKFDREPQDAEQFERRREVFAPGSPADEVVTAKSTPTDPVTIVDTETEALLRRRIADLRPGDAVLGEEGGGPARSESRAGGVTWVVDPVDGTVNFVYGIPAYTVSVAAQIDGVSVAGAVAALEALRAPDQADLFAELEDEQQTALLPRLDPEDAANILEELDDEDAADLVATDLAAGRIDVFEARRKATLERYRTVIMRALATPVAGGTLEDRGDHPSAVRLGPADVVPTGAFATAVATIAPEWAGKLDHAGLLSVQLQEPGSGQSAAARNARAGFRRSSGRRGCDEGQYGDQKSRGHLRFHSALL